MAGTANLPAAAVTQTFDVTPADLKIASVNSAASYAGEAMAPGSYAVIFGCGLSLQNDLGTALTATELGGTTVLFTGSTGQREPGGLYYVSPNQINLVIPNGLANGDGTMVVENAAGQIGSYAITFTAVNPGIFTANASGGGLPAVYALVGFPTDPNPVTWYFNAAAILSLALQCPSASACPAIRCI
jgi:uncharacterized protein (TIGR03437 family)